MIQKKFDIKLVEKYLKDHPKAKNKDLYAFTNATTDAQKQNVRRKKLILLKRKKDTNSGAPGSKTQTLTSADLERRIIEALDRDPNNAQVLGKAIDFFIKVKGKTSEMEEELNIEELINLGIVKKFND
jgi:hypothetical protein